MQLNYNKQNAQGIVIEKELLKKENSEIKVSDNVYFSEEYEKALEAIRDIIFQQKNKNDDYALVNNRILISGQRGSGKSSVLFSLMNCLKDNGMDVSFKDNEEKNHITFYCIPSVDPSYFDGKNNILTTVLSSMFSHAKKEMIDSGTQSIGNERMVKYEILLQDFDKVYKALGHIEQFGDNISRTLESLNDVSNASILHSLMNQLMEDYISFVGKNKEETKVLLVIDDLDMNVAYAAEMLEQLRKFLSLRNLVILMSANTDQLHYEMCEHYSKAFVNTLNDKNQARFIEIEDMASRYLLKLFPTSRRINVEHPVSQLLKSTLSYNGGGETSFNGSPLQESILYLVWEKTRLLFIPEENMLHPIIPTNLRELMQFIEVLDGLYSLSDSEKENRLFDSEKDYEQCEKNIKKFKEYFIKTWVPTNLRIDEENVFYSVPEKIDEINKHLINAINEIGTKRKKRLMSREVDLDIIERNADGVSIDRDIYTMVSPNDPRFVKANKISDIYNQPSNYSYGDLLLMIDKYETYFESERDRRFSNAIKIYYSIILFETMFFDSYKVNYEELAKNQNKSESRVDDIIPIQQLIGGTIYYPNYFEIITSKYFKQKGPSYDAKRAFYHKVKEDETDDMPLFSVLYYGDIRPDRYDTKHVYNTTFKQDADVDNEKYKTFDILSIINNMLNPWQTISRAQENQQDIEKWKKIIDNWKKDCTPFQNNGKLYYPNSILPFYSVDMMLRYIRKSFYIHEISNDGIEEQEKQFEYEESAANWLGFMGYENSRISFDKVKTHMKENHRIMIDKIEKIERKQKNDESKKATILYTVNKTPLSFYDLLRKIGIIDENSIINDKLVEAIGKATGQEQITTKLKGIDIYDSESEKKVREEKINNKISKVLEVLESCKFVDKVENPFNSEYIINIRTISNPSLESKDANQIRTVLQKLIDIRVVEYESKIDIFNDSDKKLLDNIKILVNAQQPFVDNVNKNTLKGKYGLEELEKRFRDYLISQIMKFYSGGLREQEMMIKGLYRYKSITEMYRYLVNILWKDAIIEYCIRQKIQNHVHTRDFVEQYYNKLWNITEKGLQCAFFKNNKDKNGTENTTEENKTREETVNKIYKNIFNNAVKCFIKEEH